MDKMDKMENFTILGERNSGTYFLQYAMLYNFNLNYVQKNEKHFFGHHEFPKETMDKTLYICIVRDPVEWIDSFFKRLRNIPPKNKENIHSFLKNEFYSIYEQRDGDKINQEIMEDRNIFTKERYKNIFELRKTKIDYFLHHIKKYVKHFCLIKYEDLNNEYESVLENICKQFNLEKKSDKYYYVIKYKGTHNQIYSKKTVLLSKEIQEYIWDNVDLQQEKQLGYL